MSLTLTFTPDEADLLGRTADALCAYLGKPVLAEIVPEPEAGFEWALFAIPLGPQDEAKDRTRVQTGGRGARFLGGCGGLDLSDGQVLDCEFLWAIQLSEQSGARYVKMDARGEAAGWSDELSELLPFALSEADAPDDQDDAIDLEDDTDAEGEAD